MSEASDKLAHSRQAIVDQVRRKEHRSSRAVRASAAEGEGAGNRGQAHDPAYPDDADDADGPGPRGSGWTGRLRYATRTWWRHHPAHMAVELVTPALADYAHHRPGRLLGISAALGALVVVTRPWKLISATGLLVAILKSSQISTLVMSAMSAADYQRDEERQR